MENPTGKLVIKTFKRVFMGFYVEGTNNEGMYNEVFLYLFSKWLYRETSLYIPYKRHIFSLEFITRFLCKTKFSLSENEKSNSFLNWLQTSSLSLISSTNRCCTSHLFLFYYLFITYSTSHTSVSLFYPITTLCLRNNVWKSICFKR